MTYFYTYSYYAYKLPLYGICFSVHDTAAGITPITTDFDDMFLAPLPAFYKFNVINLED